MIGLEQRNTSQEYLYYFNNKAEEMLGCKAVFCSHQSTHSTLQMWANFLPYFSQSHPTSPS